MYFFAIFNFNFNVLSAIQFKLFIIFPS